MLSTTVLSNVHCDTETEMTGMLRHNRIYVPSWNALRDVWTRDPSIHQT